MVRLRTLNQSQLRVDSTSLFELLEIDLYLLSHLTDSVSERQLRGFRRHGLRVSLSIFVSRDQRRLTTFFRQAQKVKTYIELQQNHAKRGDQSFYLQRRPRTSACAGCTSVGAIITA
jgi:hypothetical protein